MPSPPTSHAYQQPTDFLSHLGTVCWVSSTWYQEILYAYRSRAFFLRNTDERNSGLLPVDKYQASFNTTRSTWYCRMKTLEACFPRDLRAGRHCRPEGGSDFRSIPNNGGSLSISSNIVQFPEIKSVPSSLQEPNHCIAQRDYSLLDLC